MEENAKQDKSSIFEIEEYSSDLDYALKEMLRKKEEEKMDEERARTQERSETSTGSEDKVSRGKAVKKEDKVSSPAKSVKKTGKKQELKNEVDEDAEHDYYVRFKIRPEYRQKMTLLNFIGKRVSYEDVEEFLYGLIDEMIDRNEKQLNLLLSKFKVK